jgi:hypothetical protein
MHRQILGLASSAIEGHHKDGNGLNNRRNNLIAIPHAINCHGFATPHRKKTSRYRGVSWCSQQKQWLAHLRVRGRAMHIGRYESQKEAAIYRDAAARSLIGRFAQLNFP